MAIDNKSNLGFGDRLRNLRKIKGLSQKEMAGLLGYKHNATISNIEANRTPPDIETLNKLAEILCADLHWLITGQKRSPDESMRQNYIKSLSLLNTHINHVISYTLKSIEEFEKAVNDIVQKRQDGIKLTDAEKENLKFYPVQIEFQKTILDQFLKDQAWASKAMNDILLNNDIIDSADCLDIPKNPSKLQQKPKT